MRLTTFGLYSAGIRLITNIVDRGWFGLTPLERHIVICGCPRGGTTLLQLMMTVALNARAFNTEQRALLAGNNALRNHATLLTKRPNDILELDQIREHYANKTSRPLFLVNVRDPRDVLVSKHKDRKDEYYVPLDRWCRIFDAITACQLDEDILLIRFEELIEHPEKLGEQISSFLGLPLRRSIDSFYESVPEGFKSVALNGVRRLDNNAIGRWRSEEHRPRMCQVLRDMPEIVDQLITWQYESDDNWAHAYRSSPSPHPGLTTRAL